MHVGKLVIQRAVATVERQAFDNGMEHVATGLAAGFEDADLIGDDRVAQATMIIAVGILRMGGITIGFAPNALHVDIEKRGPAGLIGTVAPQQIPCRIAPRLRSYLSSNSVSSPFEADCHFVSLADVL